MTGTMTVEEIFTQSGDADIYVLLGDGIGEAFVLTGCRISTGIVLTVEPGTGGRRSITLPPSERYVVRVCR
jgi:hypothetical protein